jgi:hypothetical protein
MKHSKLYRCNECYSHLRGNEGCHTYDVKSFHDDKIAPCLDDTWTKGYTFPLFYEMPYQMEDTYDNRK